MHARAPAHAEDLGPALDLQLLGPVRAFDPSGALDLGGPKERTLLALLATAAGPVSPERLVDALWDGPPPATARKTLQTYVWRLRSALPTGAIPTVPGGYELRHEADTDVARFERLIAAGDDALGAHDLDRARSSFRRALELWRGEPFAGCAPNEVLQAHSVKLQELWARGVEGRIDADLRAGGHAMVVPELEEQVRATPFRERPWEMLVVALYRAGRQADALQACRRARRVLLDELGVEPGPALGALERAVLEQRPDLAAPPVGARAEPSPGAPTEGRRDGRLPVPGTRLVGRTSERRALTGLLVEQRLVTVTGVGGTGKTRLALAVGLEQSPARAVRFCDLSVVSSGGGVVDAFARATGVAAARRSAASRADGDPLATVIDELRDRTDLIVVDNCEHVVEACAQLLGRVLADCPGLHVLATSREPLGVLGEQTYVLAPLRMPVDDDDDADAVTLLVERALQAGATFEVTGGDRAAMAEICRRLDGLPLALELAAARLSHLSPSEVVERLDHRFSLLTGGERTRPDRHRTLQATLDWSYDLLAGEEQALLARLAVFAGSFDLAAVQGCCTAGGDEQCTIDLLRGLVHRSLVVADRVGPTTRFRLLDTVRAFAADRLAEQDPGDATRLAHATWFLDRLEELPWDDRLLDVGLAERLAHEHDDLRRALAWAAGAQRDDLVARLVTSMATLLFTDGDAEQLRRWFAIAADVERSRPPGQRFATTVASFHLLGRWDGDVTTLEVHRARLQELVPHLPSHHAVTSLAWAALASLSSRLPAHRPAMGACAHRALEHAPHGAHRLQAMARCQQARALLFERRCEEAISVLSDGLGAAPDDGHYSPHQDLVLAYHLAGEHARALRLATERLETAPAGPFETRTTSIYAAVAAAATGNVVTARNHLDRAVASLAAHPHPCGASDCLVAAAAVAFLAGRTTTAAAVLANLDERSVSVNALAVLLQHYRDRTRDAVPPEVWRRAERHRPS